jgi:hypothetical protein
MHFSEISALSRTLGHPPGHVEGRCKMRTSIWTRLIITGLGACAIAAFAAPASGQVLHRDGSKAAPFVADVSSQPDASSNGAVLHRDGSKAVPFVADLDGSPASTAADPFDWGDAAVGAAAGIGVMLLASAGWIAANRRRRAGALGGSSA